MNDAVNRVLPVRPTSGRKRRRRRWKSQPWRSGSTASRRSEPDRRIPNQVLLRVSGPSATRPIYKDLAKALQSAATRKDDFKIEARLDWWRVIEAVNRLIAKHAAGPLFGAGRGCLPRVEKVQSRLSKPSTHNAREGCKTRSEIAADLALGANPEIDCAMIMPTAGRVIRSEVACQEVSSLFDIFREIQVELTPRNS
jgi:hypothetical protein